MKPDIRPMPKIRPLGYERHEKIKVWAMLYALKSAPDSIQSSHLFLVLAFDLHSALQTCNAILDEEKEGSSELYVLKKWIGIEYDKLMPDLATDPFEQFFNHLIESGVPIRQVPVSELPAEVREHLKHNVRDVQKLKSDELEADAKATPQEKFFYHFQYVLDVAGATDGEKEVVDSLLERFKSKLKVKNGKR